MIGKRNKRGFQYFVSVSVVASLIRAQRVRMELEHSSRVIADALEIMAAANEVKQTREDARETARRPQPIYWRMIRHRLNAPTWISRWGRRSNVSDKCRAEDGWRACAYG